MSVIPSLFDRARTEIVDLHRFFVAWYDAGSGAKPDFARFEQAMGDGFHMIPPDGHLLGREAVLAYVRANRDSQHGDFSIDIDDIRPGWEAGDMIVVTYIEAQRRGGTASRRQASALFTANSSAPGGVEWRHLHETWLQMPMM